MADKNQMSLANGIPQFSNSNSVVMQTNYMQQNQQTVHSAGVDQGINASQKQSTPIANGQLLQNSRNPNSQNQADHQLNYFPSCTGDNSFRMQSATTNLIQQPLIGQGSKTNFTQYTNPQPQINQHSIPQNPTSFQHNILQPTSSQSLLNMSPRNQNLTKPTPQFGIRPNFPPTGIMPQVRSSGGGDASQHFYPQSNKLISSTSGPALNPIPPSQTVTAPVTSQPPSMSVIPGKFKQVNSFTAPPPPISKPTISNSQNLNYTQGSHISPSISESQLPNVTQSFPPSNIHSSLQPGCVGYPKGLQPSNLGTNQLPHKTSMPETPPLFNSNRDPMQNNSREATPTYQNQVLGNRNLGPPPKSSLSGPTMTTPLHPNSNRSTLPSGYSSGLKYPGANSLVQGMERMSVTQHGYNKLWGMENVDLLQCRNILPPQKVTPPPIRLHQEGMDNVNCSPEIFCCTLNKIPETNSLLQKSRLPLGILIHPFRDLSQLAVIQCSSIVRCRACRTYINPFVYFIDNKRWKCNLCFRINELPDEFQFDPVSKTYGDPSRRPEIRSSTIEFIAPSEYMLRPPQPAIYLFVLDVSRWGCDSGYLDTLCSILLEELDNIPGDSRTQIGFILFDSKIHFFSIAENYNQAHEMIVSDIDDVFLPTPDSLLVNLNENRQLIRDLLQEIPKKYAESFDTDSALGPALQAAYKLMSPTGGRITVFQSCLPNKGPGNLNPREDPNQRSSKDIRHLGPQTDFYKRLSLDCSTQQISVDLFLISSQYADLATLSGISQFSGGCIYHFPLFRRVNPESNERLSRALRRYLTRKIGFEAVMRVRCSRGLSIHTFHGNFFVRSTDLLSLPNVNPDAGFGMQIAIEDSLFELQCVCFQAAVLYTSAKGERRIRVHTLCLPVSSNLNEILTSADQQAIIGLLGKMAVDRSLKSNLSDAREAFINVAIDILSAYKLIESSGGQNSIMAPINLSLIPLYILALLKSTAFRTGQNTRLDDRVYAMTQMKTLPLRELIQLIHPDLYHVTNLDDQNSGVEFEDKLVAQPPRLSLSSEHLDSRGAFLLDTPEVIYLLVGKNINSQFLIDIFDVRDVRQINKEMVYLPELENDNSEKLRNFINFLQSEKPWPAVINIVTEPRPLTQFFINDKTENAFSYYELLHHVKAQLK